MKLIHRYNINVTKGDLEEPRLELVTSLYRPHVDSGYQSMLTDMLEARAFDAFICAMIQGLITQGQYALTIMG